MSKRATVSRASAPIIPESSHLHELAAQIALTTTALPDLVDPSELLSQVSSTEFPADISAMGVDEPILQGYLKAEEEVPVSDAALAMEGAWHRRWFVLRRDGLAIHAREDDAGPDGALAFIPLREVTGIAAELPARATPYTFALSTHDRVWVLAAPLEAARRHWLTAIAAALVATRTDAAREVSMRVAALAKSLVNDAVRRAPPAANVPPPTSSTASSVRAGARSSAARVTRTVAPPTAPFAVNNSSAPSRNLNARIREQPPVNTGENAELADLERLAEASLESLQSAPSNASKTSPAAPRDRAKSPLQVSDLTGVGSKNAGAQPSRRVGSQIPAARVASARAPSATMRLSPPSRTTSGLSRAASPTTNPVKGGGDSTAAVTAPSFLRAEEAAKVAGNAAGVGARPLPRAPVRPTAAAANAGAASGAASDALAPARAGPHRLEHTKQWVSSLGVSLLPHGLPVGGGTRGLGAIFSSGVALCALVEKAFGKAGHCDGVDSKPRSRAAAHANLEKGLQVCWRNGVKKACIPTADDISEGVVGSDDRVGSLLCAVFETAALRLIRERERAGALGWASAVLNAFGIVGSVTSAANAITGGPFLAVVAFLYGGCGGARAPATCTTTIDLFSVPARAALPKGVRGVALTVLRELGVRVVVTEDTFAGIDEDVASLQICYIFTALRARAPAVLPYGEVDSWESAQVAHDCALAGIRSPPSQICLVSWRVTDGAVTEQSRGSAVSMEGFSCAVVGHVWADGPAWDAQAQTTTQALTEVQVPPAAISKSEARTSDALAPLFDDTRMPRVISPARAPALPSALAAEAGVSASPRTLVASIRRERDRLYFMAVSRVSSSNSVAAPETVARIARDWANARACAWAEESLPAARVMATGTSSAGLRWVDVALSSEPDLEFSVSVEEVRTTVVQDEEVSSVRALSRAVTPPRNTEAVSFQKSLRSTSPRPAPMSPKGTTVRLSAVKDSGRAGLGAGGAPRAVEPHTTPAAAATTSLTAKWSESSRMTSPTTPGAAFWSPQLVSARDATSDRVVALFSPSPPRVASERTQNMLAAATSRVLAAAATPPPSFTSPASTVMASPSPPRLSSASFHSSVAAAVAAQEPAKQPSSNAGAFLLQMASAIPSKAPPPPPPSQPRRRPPPVEAPLPPPFALQTGSPIFEVPVKLRSRSGLGTVLLRAVETPSTTAAFPIGAAGDVLLIWDDCSVSLSDVSIARRVENGISLRIAPAAISRTARATGGLVGACGARTRARAQSFPF